MEFIVMLDGTSAKRCDGSLNGTVKWSKSSFGYMACKVMISYGANIPFKFVSRVLQGANGADTNSQDGLEVLDIVLRQQAATRRGVCWSGSPFSMIIEETMLMLKGGYQAFDTSIPASVPLRGFIS